MEREAKMDTIAIKLAIAIIMLMLMAMAINGVGGERAKKDRLRYGYYSESCPQVEEIVKREVASLYHEHGNTAVSFLRNIFHDCVVQGCDASILLDSTTKDLAEKESSKNFGMRNYKYIDVIKEAVEKHCPNTVSCADILVLSGRDGIAMLDGPYIQVKTGRKDSRISKKGIADAVLFANDVDISTLLSHFSKMNLKVDHVVALLGAHTVGRTHCKDLVKRLYPIVDPTLNQTYAEYLKQRCPSPIVDLNAVEYARNDHETPMKFDNQYYHNVMLGKGLLKVDAMLYNDPRTSPYVQKMAQDNAYFFKTFSEAISILTLYQPLIGSHGEIRQNCHFVNT